MRDIKNRDSETDDSIHELNFDDEDTPPPRSGDPRVARGEIDPEISAQRVRQAGRTGGEVAGGGSTADDLTPETLLDEYEDTDRPTDKKLRVVDADKIGGGIGKDEAELANEQGAPE
jgi:hypothetical protein